MQEEAAVCKVTLEDTVVVPPRSETLVCGRLSKPSQAPALGIVEPNTNFSEEHSVLLASTLTSHTNGQVPLRIMNPNETHLVLSPGTVAASYSPVDTIGRSYNDLPNRQVPVTPRTCMG